MKFPLIRKRRLRKNESFRRLVRETRVSADDFIFPLFVCPGNNVKNEIASMPGNFQMSIENIVEECGQISELGIPGVILFGIPENKDDVGSESYSDSGIVQRAVAEIKKLTPVC